MPVRLFRRALASNECLKNSQAFEVGREGMLGRFPHFSRVAIKLVEVAGAGCASAVVAFMLDNSRHPPVVPTVQPPAVVRLAPADAQMIETVRSESVALAEHLRSELETRSTASAPLPPSKPVKAAVAPAPKRDQKPARPQAVEVKPRVPEAKPVQIEAKTVVPEAKPVLSGVPYPDPAVPYPAATTTTSADSADRPSTLTAGKEQSSAPTAPSSSWLARLGSAADIPRPPVAIGQFAASAVN
jgi:hypothetical protein